MEVLTQMPGSSTGPAIRASLRRSRPDTLPDKTLVVRDIRSTAAQLAAYDRVCGFPLASLLPITFPHVLAFPMAMRLMTDAAFPFPVIGLVHIGNSITQTRPISIDDSMTLSVHTADLRAHERGDQFDLIATAEIDGVEVWRDVSTYLHRGPAPSRSAAARPEPPGPGPRPVPTALWQIGRSIGREYAAASGDRNPIHTSRIGARLFGFPGRIAHGMWTMARTVSALQGRLPEAYTVDVAFKTPILLGSTVILRADRTAAGWDLHVSRAKTGAPHLTGTITYR